MPPLTSRSGACPQDSEAAALTEKQKTETLQRRLTPVAMQCWNFFTTLVGRWQGSNLGSHRVSSSGRRQISVR